MNDKIKEIAKEIVSELHPNSEGSPMFERSLEKTISILERELVQVRAPVLMWEIANYGVEFARTPFGEYGISVPQEKQFVCECSFDDDYREVHLTFERAISACQSDYERRIYEAINQNRK